MFSFPQMIGVPILVGLDAGTAHWPTVGVVLSWMLLAALVGSGLGILRDLTRSQDDAGSLAPPVTCEALPSDIDYSHRDAA